MDLMNENALARLEAALRAQREKLSSTPHQVAPSLSPADNPLGGPLDVPTRDGSGSWSKRVLKRLGLSASIVS